MGPSNPWSPNWQPDPTGGRLLTIRVARRGAYLAAGIYLPIAVVAAFLAVTPLASLSTDLTSASTTAFATIAVLSGLPGVALLGAGLAPAALGSKIDAIVVGVAVAIGAPVAATTSFVIWGWVIDSWLSEQADLAAPFLRSGVSAAMHVAPLVAIGAAAWVILVRRISPPLPTPPPSASTRP
jgi:hypothetical protein